jgi:hypothetical protein
MSRNLDTHIQYLIQELSYITFDYNKDENKNDEKYKEEYKNLIENINNKLSFRNSSKMCNEDNYEFPIINLTGKFILRDSGKKSEEVELNNEEAYIRNVSSGSLKIPMPDTNYTGPRNSYLTYFFNDKYKDKFIWLEEDKLNINKSIEKKWANFTSGERIGNDGKNTGTVRYLRWDKEERRKKYEDPTYQLKYCVYYDDGTINYSQNEDDIPIDLYS